eukprot:scaffold197132_cov48-Prasinocladus_malaysianus.AAC.1
MIIRFQPESGAAAAAAKQEAKSSGSSSQRSSCSSTGRSVAVPFVSGDALTCERRGQAKLSNRLNPNNVDFDPVLAERYKRMSKLEKEMLWASDRNSRVAGAIHSSDDQPPCTKPLPAFQSKPMTNGVYGAQTAAHPPTPVGSWGSQQSGTPPNDFLRLKDLWASVDPSGEGLARAPQLSSEVMGWRQGWGSEPASLSSALSRLLSPMATLTEGGEGLPMEDTFTYAPAALRPIAAPLSSSSPALSGNISVGNPHMRHASNMGPNCGDSQSPQSWQQEDNRRGLQGCS